MDGEGLNDHVGNTITNCTENPDTITQDEINSCKTSNGISVNEKGGGMEDNSTEIPSNDKQAIYSYINQIYCDINKKIDDTNAKLRSDYDARCNNLSNMQVDINSRLLLCEENIKGLEDKWITRGKRETKRKETVTDSQKNIEKLESMLLAAKQDISTNLTLSMQRYNDYIHFKNEHEKNVLPILDRINSKYMESGEDVVTSNIARNNVSGSDRVNNNDRDNNNGNRTSDQSEHSNHIENLDSIRIDCEVLFLGDSNIANLKPEIMNNGTKAQKRICYTFQDLFEAIENFNVIKKPKCVYVQCGTNDMECEDLDQAELKNTINELISKLKSKLGNTIAIVISSLLPRQDFKENVEVANLIIEETCDVSPKVKFLDHSQNIKEEMLKGRKHIDGPGFSTLLSNIRFTLFGKLPKFRNRNNNNDRRWVPARRETYYDNRDHRSTYPRYDHNGYQNDRYADSRDDY